MSHKTVLIVEDDPKSLYALHSILTDKGFGVTSCHSAEEAAEYMHQRFDAALLDIRLPGEQGTTFAGRLLKDHPDTRVVFMTAHNGITKLRERFPDSPVFLKPLDVDAILKHL